MSQDNEPGKWTPGKFRNRAIIITLSSPQGQNSGSF